MRQPTITGDVWFNTKPLMPEDVRGKVVLVDFWTYSCVNCERTIPYLRAWWEKYQRRGLVIVGVHTPEFEFEKEPKNVAAAIKTLGVTWPVVLDNSYVNWNAFANRYWPAKYLADKNGLIVYTHFGEGNYRETEHAIQKLLGDGRGMPGAAEEHHHGNVCFVATPELYCGYLRGHLNPPQSYEHNRPNVYEAPPELKENAIALSGSFIARPEYIESAGAGAELLVRFRATEVNLVLSPVEGRARAIVSFEGNLPDAPFGRDVEDSGEVVVGGATLYNLLQSDTLIDGVLRIRAKEGAFRAYAFTFSGCA